MRLETTQIVRSAQIWVCDTCGGQDHKSCGCNSTARMELLAKKRADTRKRVQRLRDRDAAEADERDLNVTRYADVENIEETPEASADAMRARFAEMEDNEPGDDDQTVWRRGLSYRARTAASGATFEDWSKFSVDEQIVQEVRAAAEAWEKLASYLEELQHGK